MFKVIIIKTDTKEEVRIYNDKLFNLLSKIKKHKFVEFNNADIIINQMFTSDKKVPDVLRYTIHDNNQRELKKGIDKFDFIDDIKENNPIVIILESPHDKEYDAEFNPIAPANGSTGKKIENELCNVLYLINREISLNIKDRPVLLVNPIPYQTSLHYLLKTKIDSKIRNMVWKELWRQDTTLKEDFIKRIESYKPYIILNATTKEVKSDVTEALNEISKDSIIVNTHHPFSWGGYGIEI